MAGKERPILLLISEVAAEKRLELARLARDYEIWQAKEDVVPEEILKRTEILYGDTEEVMARLLSLPEGRLRWVQVLTAGFDHLDVEALTQRGVLVSTARGIHGTQMAESLFAMLLGVARGLLPAVRHQREKRWERDVPHAEITGRTLLLVGVGAVGQVIARTAQRGFDMTVLGIRRQPQPMTHVNEVATWAERGPLLNRADIVVNLLPYDKTTHHLYDRGFFQSLRPGTWFANLGRGGSVDSQALLAALDAEQVGLALLDVFEEEPLPPESPFWLHPRVVLTPHIAGFSDRYGDYTLALFRENLQAFLQTGTPARNLLGRDVFL